VPLLSGVVNGRRPLVWERTQRDPNDSHASLDYAADVIHESGWNATAAKDGPGTGWCVPDFSVKASHFER